MRKATTRQAGIPLWRDERALQFLGQALFAVAILGFILYISRNMLEALSAQGLVLGYSFLQGLAGFDIAETLIGYSRESAYWQALQAGLYNTLLVSLLGIIFSTILGVILGVARISSNWLVNRLAALYLEVMRNLSLLVFLIFWYLGVFLKLPRVKDTLVWGDSIFLSNRGVGIPWALPGESFPAYRTFLLVGLALALVVWVTLRLVARRSGRAPLAVLWALLAFLVTAGIGWFLQPAPPLNLDYPYVKGLNLAGGKILSPEFMALLSGLVLYTGAFIGEVVRAGILAVSRGQVDAARALGFNGFQTLRLVIFPQALRVIIPPLTSQYLNLAKNSSLAVAIGYPDLFYVSSTIINQTGRAVEMIGLVMFTYLLISLATSLFMNWYNQQTRLVER